VDMEAIRFFIGVGCRTDLYHRLQQPCHEVGVGTEVYVPVVRMPSFRHQNSVEVKITDTT
jgi:hypothetical protein